MLSSSDKIKVSFQALRVEEFIGFLFLAPTISFAAFENLRIPGSWGLVRVGLIATATIYFYWQVLSKNETPVFRIIRDFAPFLLTIAIYMNIHDTIRILNPNDIHDRLVQWDQWLFGVQPVVWIENIYHPVLTEWMSFSYVSYYWITLVLVTWLYARERQSEFRVVMFTMMISYYIGFICYVLFPAASPYIVIPEQFNQHVWSSGGFLSDLTRSIVSLSPERPRDAFPSLHTGVTLLTMIMAWRYNRTLFWIFTPMAMSLPLATVYLRYHYAVDVLVGLVVPIMALYLAPRIEDMWLNFSKADQKRAIQ